MLEPFIKNCSPASILNIHWFVLSSRDGHPYDLYRKRYFCSLLARISHLSVTLHRVWGYNWFQLFWLTFTYGFTFTFFLEFLSLFSIQMSFWHQYFYLTNLFSLLPQNLHFFAHNILLLNTFFRVFLDFVWYFFEAEDLRKVITRRGVVVLSLDLSCRVFNL